MEVENGYSFYGQPVGVMVFSQASSRIPGDPGHNGTFSYPVCYEIIEGSSFQLMENNPEMEQTMVNAALSLKNKGVKAIIGDCGLMSLYQREMAKAAGIPVLASSLSLIPLAWNTIGGVGSIGVLTGHSDMLNEHHLKASGWTEDIRISVQGMQEEPHFRDVVIEHKKMLVPSEMNQAVQNAVSKLFQKSPDVKAIILECSNLPSYGSTIAEKFHLPVFDIVEAANFLYRCVQPVNYGCI